MLPWTLTHPQPLPVLGPTVVAIGNFDGVHAGHRHLLALALTEARAHNMPLVVLTFEPHPRTVLQPNTPLPRLTTEEEKITLLHAAGAQGVAILPFTPATAALTPEAFIETILKSWLHTHTVYVGEDFRFGHKASGNVQTLQAASLAVRAVPLHADEHGIVSSTRLRSTPKN